MQPRNLTETEELRLFTVASFFYEYDEFSVEHLNVYLRNRAICGMAATATAGWCSLEQGGLKAIKQAYQEIIAIGYSTRTREEFISERQ